MNYWIVRIFEGQWLAPWAGDPGRTSVKGNAKKYPSISSATFALAHARRYCDLKDAVIEGPPHDRQTI